LIQIAASLADCRKVGTVARRAMTVGAAEEGVLDCCAELLHPAMASPAVAAVIRRMSDRMRAPA
jgi:hypothetical protein